MKTVKQTAEYTIVQRRDNRYAVRGADKKWINGEAKVEILVKEGLIKEPPRKAAPEPEADSATEAEESGAEGGEEA
ncbi:MAG TPA: hypothetical protein VK973_17040 [Arenicellales bacterium]|nr:hypothetical protein [Arenicellales bacterium]